MLNCPIKKLFVSLFTISLIVGTPSILWADEPICQQPWPDGEEVAEISAPEIDESSGLADSWLHSDRLWTHNDSGDSPRLWAMRKDGTVTTEINIEGAENIDWEDMAIAPCSAQDEQPCLYVGDFGDNLSVREEVTIYRFPEPDLGDNPPDELTITNFESLVYQYDTGPRDAETLLVHPQTRQMWVIEKTGETHVDVFAIPEEFDAHDPLIVSAIATLEIPGSFSIARMITAGDISPNGAEFTLRTYLELFTYCAEDPDDFETAFAAPASQVMAMPPVIQGEALTYDRHDGALWLTSEQLPAPLIRIPPRHEERDDEDIADPAPSDADAGNIGDVGPDEDASNTSDPDTDSQSTGSACSTLPGSPEKQHHFLLTFAGMIVFMAYRKNRV